MRIWITTCVGVAALGLMFVSPALSDDEIAAMPAMTDGQEAAPEAESEEMDTVGSEQEVVVDSESEVVVGSENEDVVGVDVEDDVSADQEDVVDSETLD